MYTYDNDVSSMLILNMLKGLMGKKKLQLLMLIKGVI